MNPYTRRTAGLAALAAAVVLTAGCGGSDHDGTGAHPAGDAPSAASVSPGATVDKLDITFAQGMIPHHQQALEMATAAEAKASTPEVKALATKIRQAQAPEIAQMNRMLAAWGAAPASPPPGDGHGSGHDASAMPGMLTADEMNKLMAAGGADFDRMFLELMIKHHQGAVEMARKEQQHGRNPAAKTLAATIEKDQLAEIAEMQRLLGR